jgi:hypothetical protein
MKDDLVCIAKWRRKWRASGITEQGSFREDKSPSARQEIYGIQRFNTLFKRVQNRKKIIFLYSRHYIKL